MKTVLLKLKKFIRQQISRLPSALPNGMTEFETWASDIIDTYNFPNNDSVRFTLATMIMHSGPSDAFKSKHSFMLMIRASMAKQIAAAQFQEIKNRQKQLEQDALAAAKATEVQSNESTTI